MAWGVGAAGAGVNSKSAGTTLNCPINAAVAVGDVLVLFYAGDNDSSHTTDSTASTISVADSRGNTWVMPGGQINGQGSAGGGADLQFAYTRVTTALTTAHSITVTGPNVTARAFTYAHFTVGASISEDTAPRFAQAFDASTPPLIISNAPTANSEHLWLHGVACERPNTDSFSPDSNYTAFPGNTGTTGGSAVTNMYVRGAYRIHTSGTSEAVNASIGASGDGAQVLFCLVEAGGGPSPITGTASVTEAADTLTGAGAVAATGTTNATEAADTLSATGTVTSTATGTASITEAADTLVGAGTVSVTGTAVLTEAADTITAAGVVAVTGTASVTEAADTLTGAGAVAATGTTNATEAADTLSAAGTVASVSTGTANLTEAADTLVGVGAVAVTGALTKTEAADTSSATGTVLITGSLTATEAPNTTTAAGAVAITGTSSVTEAPNTLTGAGAALVQATSNVLESADTLGATAVLLIAGTAAYTEIADTLDAAGHVANPFITGTADITEGADNLAALGVVLISAFALIDEAADTLDGDAVQSAPAVYDLAHQVFVRLVNDEVLAFLALSECVVQASEEELRALLEVDEARTMSQPDEFTFQL
jgi:hypothetical protein